jgi:serine/threonine protein kinase
VAKIADFGLACYSDPTSKGQQLFCGSDTYMAPEIIKQKSNPDLEDFYKDKNLYYNSRIDIWALGCLTYELFTGSTPFIEKTYRQLHLKILQTEPDL